MQKSIYLTKRKPGLTHDGFVARWRQHGALAMSKFFFRDMAAYVQAEVIQPAAITGMTEDFDGVAYIKVRDHEPTQREYDELQAMVEDEHETFEGAILPRLLMVEEKVVRAGPTGGTTAFLFFRDAASAGPVADHYLGSAAGRIILNLRREDLAWSEMSALVPYAAVVEISASDPSLLAEALGVGEAEPWRQADLAVLTRECVMWDRLP